MIVYIFNSDYYKKVVLPIKISGVYQITGSNGVFLGNIEEENGRWKLFLGMDFVLSSPRDMFFKLYDVMTLRNINDSSEYILYTSPVFDNNVIRCAVKNSSVKIGNLDDCDIKYTNSLLGNETIMLTFFDRGCLLETDSNNVFVMDERSTRCNLYDGDYVFFYGFRLIVFDKIIVFNNPNGLVMISQNNLQMIALNQTKMEVVVSKISEDTPLWTKDNFYFKSPRFDSVIEEENLKIDEPPAREKTNEDSLLMSLGPQLTMILTCGISIVMTINNFMSNNNENNKLRMILSISTMAITAIGSISWPIIMRYINKKRVIKRENKRLEKYRIYLKKKQDEIQSIKQKQKQILIENATTTEKCLLALDKRERILWQRNIEHDDFLQINLGTGETQTKLKITEPEEKFSLDEVDELYKEFEEVVNSSLQVDGVPQVVKLTEEYVMGVVGRNEFAKPFLDNLFLQIMTLHSYVDLKIIVYTNNINKWNYLKIIPHCWNNSKSIRYFASNIEEFNDIINDLEKIFDNRVKNDESEKLADDGSTDVGKRDLYKGFKPYYLIFTDNIMGIRNVSLIKKILNYKQNVGFSVLMLNDRLSTLPSETTSFVILDREKSGLIKNDLSRENQKQFVANYIGNVDIYECAKKVSNIPLNVEKEKYELPSSLSFLEMYGVGKVEQLNISERWKNNNPTNTLAVPIGVDQNGEIFKMDIHEKVAGPHGLVAGTTGSGKSEWIITFILSLAVNFHPDEVQFVLIDYKGGGLALSFENEQMGIKLPHLAGTITNLDKSEINRSIASMESELKRRQAVFNAAREKLKEGSMNIYKYQQFYRKKMVDEPMSHLLIICDEFAELKQQQPEFMEQLISISRIGRSLGVHLILATQKPSGVVNDQIWSNSKFKVCLKVQDKSDSNEILKKPDAAFLKQVGAFYLEIGNDDYYNLGQSAWAGAKYYPSEVLQKKVEQSVQYINNIGKVVNYYDDESGRSLKNECKGEELLNIIQYIDAVSKKETIVGRQLWLPNVQAVSYLGNLIKKYGHNITPYIYNVAIGEYDEPRKQEQGLLEINLDKGNVAIIGQVSSGKEKLISTLILSSILEHTPTEINYYVIDMGAEVLKKFSKFPHVGEVVVQSEPDKIINVLELVISEQDKRKELFVDYNGSFEYYNKTSKDKLPLIVVVINVIEIFEETMPKIADALNTLYRDGPRYGIIYVVSASNQNALRQRQLQYFNHIIVMQLQDDSMYRSLTNCRRGLLPSKKFGRGICKIGDSVDTYCEFQTATIVDDDKELEYLKDTATKMREYYKVKAKQLAKIPDNVTSDDLTKYVDVMQNVPLGYDFYEKTIAKYDFSKEKIYLITGRSIKENINSVYGIIAVLSKISNVKVRIVDLIQIFEKPLIDIKFFNDKLDVVMAAIEKDVLNRNETQDNAINIIIGAGRYKQKLSNAGIEIFQNIFNNLLQAKKETFILIDDYDKLRTLKLESWYGQVNNNYGIWLGSGLNNQSLFAINEMNEDDKKYNFAGLAYMISDAKYTVIKSVMDSDD